MLSAEGRTIRAMAIESRLNILFIVLSTKMSRIFSHDILHVSLKWFAFVLKDWLNLELEKINATSHCLILVIYQQLTTEIA